MNTRFLEIDSTYRNRKEYPNPADFTVLISQTGTKDNFSACDPISDACPVKIFNPLLFSLVIGKIQKNNGNTGSSFIACFPFSRQYSLSKSPDYYTGVTVEIKGEKRIIATWEYASTNVLLNVDCFFITLKLPIFLPIETDDTIKFIRTTTLRTQVPVFFIEGGVNADYFYTDYIIYNETLSIKTNKQNYRTIISYDGLVTKLAGIDINTENINDWKLSDTYILRYKPPQEIGRLLNGTTSTAVLPNYCSNTNDIYAGSFLRITSGKNKNIISRISSHKYNTKDKRIELILSDTLKYPLKEGISFEILQFSRDNAVPFTFTGSTVSQQEMVCYEIGVLDLVLPNTILQEGGRSAFYPFMYVELQNVSASSAGNTNIIISNNPNSIRMLFRCPIGDLTNPLISPFIKIDADGAKQTIKFKPNDNLKFAVYLPNGELFKTVEEETFSPCPPNNFIQIRALFSIRRL